MSLDAEVVRSGQIVQDRQAGRGSGAELRRQESARDRVRTGQEKFSMEGPGGV